jgi:hypothetical protein
MIVIDDVAEMTKEMWAYLDTVVKGKVMDEIWFWMARFFAELFLFVGLVVGLIVVVFVVAIFLSGVNWLRGKIKKLKGKE